MKGKIDKEGFLWIERAGEMKEQVCPHTKDDINCGDWCPLFQDQYPYTRADHIEGMVLEICQVSIFFDEFEDERGAE